MDEPMKTKSKDSQHPDDILNRYDGIAKEHCGLINAYVKFGLTRQEAIELIGYHIKANKESALSLMKIIMSKKK